MKIIDEIEEKDEDLMKKKRNIEQELYKIHDYFAEGAILRSRCTWYEKGEKSTKYLLSLEKGQAVNSSIDVLLSDDGHIDKQNEIQNCIKKSFQTLFENKDIVGNEDSTEYISQSNVEQLTEKKLW